jgi:hypothetical protein
VALKQNRRKKQTTTSADSEAERTDADALADHFAGLRAERYRGRWTPSAADRKELDRLLADAGDLSEATARLSRAFEADHNDAIYYVGRRHPLKLLVKQSARFATPIAPTSTPRPAASEHPLIADARARWNGGVDVADPRWALAMSADPRTVKSMLADAVDVEEFLAHFAKGAHCAKG